MTIDKDRDFLDILRFLNKDNINDSSIRDEFFKSLMVISDDAPKYLSILSSAYSDGFEKQYEGINIKNYLLSNVFCNEISNQLKDSLIEDKISHLYINKRSSAHAVTYVGSIKGMKKLIESSSEHFDYFKTSLLIGLITRYCRDLSDRKNINIERLNKLLVIYIEHIKKLDESKDIPMVIDDEFIKEILDYKKYTFIDTKSVNNALYHLINRIYPPNTKEYTEYDEYGYKRK